MSPSARVINLVLSAVLIVGGYQFYFWCQRHPLTPTRELNSPIDERIPFVPAWVWVYSFLYYPAILCVNFVARSSDEFNRIAASYMLLLAMQAAFFVVLPVRTPDHWRDINEDHGLSGRFLAFVHRFDAPSNSFPSMHTSVAVLTAMHLTGTFGTAVYLFPALIAISCLFTKQHYLVDLPAGAGLGWVAHEAYRLVLAVA
jgi:membrane-associated phospholipid phosphatase